MEALYCTLDTGNIFLVMVMVHMVILRQKRKERYYILVQKYIFVSLWKVPHIQSWVTHLRAVRKQKVDMSKGFNFQP